MDDVVNRFARELADAIAAAVAENPQVEACREKARAAGFRDEGHARGCRGLREPLAVGRADQGRRLRPASCAPRRTFEVTANDRRFLRSLRIAADETAEPVE